MNTKSKYFKLSIISIMNALMLILALTPLGTISLGLVSITIAHIPILITTIILGLKEGLVTAAFFGVFSLVKALVAPAGILDPLFINPLISILPRLFIPITTHFVYKLTKGINNVFAIAISLALGNLTNTFLVYTSMFLFVRSSVEQIMGKDIITVIIGLLSTSTAIKTVLIVILTTPIILALQRFLGQDKKKKKKEF